jgi:hypothetical protein
MLTKTADADDSQGDDADEQAAKAPRARATTDVCRRMLTKTADAGDSQGDDADERAAKAPRAPRSTAKAGIAKAGTAKAGTAKGKAAAVAKILSVAGKR